MSYMRDLAGRRLDSFQVQDAAAARPIQVADVSSAGSPAALTFRRRWARRELFTLQIPFGSLDLSQDPTASGGTIWNAVAYVNGGLTVGYSSAGALTIGHTTDSTQTESYLHMWQARPFATVDLNISSVTASAYGNTGIEWRSPDGTKRILAYYSKQAGNIQAAYLVNGTATISMSPNLAVTPTGPFTLRVQMAGRYITVWYVNQGVTTYAGRVDFSASLDLRDPAQIAGWTVGIGGRGYTDYQATITGASHYLAGCGHADPRIVSYEDGSPIQSGENVWVLMTTRGTTIPDAYQGVYQLNTTTGQLTATGAIFCNRGDGIVRNDNAGHLMYDRLAGQWRYFTIGHSDYPNARLVYLATTSVDLRFGVHTAPVSQVNITGDDGVTTFYEDFHPIWDSTAAKWVASASQNASISARLEAASPAGPWTLITTAGTNETGNLILKSGTSRYVLAGTNNTGAATSFIVRDYNTLAQVGNLTTDFATTAVRTWPAVFPVQTAAGVRWHMLTFDRTTPGGQAYTYGRLHLYGT